MVEALPTAERVAERLKGCPGTALLGGAEQGVVLHGDEVQVRVRADGAFPVPLVAGRVHTALAPLFPGRPLRVLVETGRELPL